MRHLIKRGRVVDPESGTDDVLDIVVASGKIEKIDRNLGDKADKTIDAGGMIVAPGFIDMHVHLREPGREDEETVKTGTRAALRGGFTSVACMANTEPALDSGKAAGRLKAIIKRDSAANVFMIGAITKGRLGKVLADLKALAKEGVLAISDDGSSVENRALLEKALKEAKKKGLLVIEHCEDPALSAGGVVNEGFVSTKMGLRGIPRQSEYERVRRDIEIAKKTSARLHIAHVSCRESVDLIRKAKSAGIGITAETAPHYFSLTEDCCAAYDTNTKMNPPLRAAEDVEAMKKGLADGAIDVIATDHAPHTDAEKDVEFDAAPFGIIGLETALSLAVMELVDKKVLSWSGLVSKMSANPAKILALEGRGSLKRGSIADIVIIDPDKKYVYERASIESKSKNSPFLNWGLKGKVTSVFVGGMLVMSPAGICAME